MTETDRDGRTDGGRRIGFFLLVLCLFWLAAGWMPELIQVRVPKLFKNIFTFGVQSSRKVYESRFFFIKMEKGEDFLDLKMGAERKIIFSLDSSIWRRGGTILEKVEDILELKTGAEQGYSI